MRVGSALPSEKTEVGMGRSRPGAELFRSRKKWKAWPHHRRETGTNQAGIYELFADIILIIGPGVLRWKLQT
jgi:hypothetical protein